MIDRIQQNVVFKGGIKAKNPGNFSGSAAASMPNVRDNYRNTIENITNIQKTQSEKIGNNINTIA